MNPQLDIRNHTMGAMLEKRPADFTREDFHAFVRAHDIRMVNFMYPASDGRLKTLNFVLHSEEYLDWILTAGERVDGSSLFPHFIEAGSSDLYVVPRLRTAFIDPFVELPTLCFLCSFFNKEGKQLESSPQYILHKAARRFTEQTGMRYEAMGELEYYVAAPLDDVLSLFPAENQRGYHESSPFAKFNDFRTKCMYYITLCGGSIKYGHSEVGNFTNDGRIFEQNEIEFLPTDVEHAADSLVIAKWIIRTLASRLGLDVSFAPKITEGKAGSGLHVHMRVMRDSGNMLLDGGKLSDTAHGIIAGMMRLAPSITAFGNTNPTSYFRLVPHQEAPTSICWGDRNRSAMVRVPLGWIATGNMAAELNPGEERDATDASWRQTVEIRSADGSADVYLLMAALAVACRYGLGLGAEGLDIARRTYVDVNIHSSENEEKLNALEQLPSSCVGSADELERQRAIYEADGVFDRATIEGIIRRLRSFNDGDIRVRAKSDSSVMRNLVREFYYCG